MSNNVPGPSDDASLARLMDFAQGDGPLWSPQELHAIMRHQLQVPLTSVPDATENKVLASSLDHYAQSAPPIRTFGDLLFHARPPVELLDAVKQFAKACRSATDAAAPDEIATMLYVMSIAAAMTKCDRRISTMDTTALRHCLAWGLEQTWLDPSARKLLEQGYEAVGSES